ncbi:MAG TPA: replication initiation protein [Trueperaceae bacterium]
MSPYAPNQASLAAPDADPKYVGKSYDPEKASVTIGNDLATAFSALSLPERNLLALAISRVHRSDEQLQPVVIELEAYRRIFLNRESTNNSVHAQMRSACRELSGKDARLYSKDGTGARVRLVRGAALEPSLKSGLMAVTIELHPDLSPFLINLAERGRFTSVPLRAFTSLRGQYSIPLLLLLHARKGRQKRFVTTPALANLRDWLGVREGSYPLWQDFKTRVLQTAIAELAGLLEVTFSGRKWGRSVNRVEFKVTVVPQETTQIGARDDYWSELQGLLNELEFTGQIDRYIRPLGVKVVHAKVLEVREVVRTREAAGDPVMNPGGYLRNSLEALLTSQTPGHTKALSDPQDSGAGRFSDATAAGVYLHRQWEKARSEAALKAWSELDDDRKKLIDEAVRQARVGSTTRHFLPAPDIAEALEREVQMLKHGLLRFEGELTSPAAFDEHRDVLRALKPVERNAARESADY